MRRGDPAPKLPVPEIVGKMAEGFPPGHHFVMDQYYGSVNSAAVLLDNGQHSTVSCRGDRPSFLFSKNLGKKPLNHHGDHHVAYFKKDDYVFNAVAFKARSLLFFFRIIQEKSKNGVRMNLQGRRRAFYLSTGIHPTSKVHLLRAYGPRGRSEQSHLRVSFSLPHLEMENSPLDLAHQSRGPELESALQFQQTARTKQSRIPHCAVSSTSSLRAPC